MSKDKSKENGFVKIPKKVKDLNKQREELEFLISEISDQIIEANKETKIKCSGSFSKPGCLKYLRVYKLTKIDFLCYNSLAYEEGWDFAYDGFRCPECGCLTLLEINKDAPEEIKSVRYLFGKTIQEEVR